MLQRFNMLALIVLLVFQTMITPVAATAQGIVEQDANTETTEDVGSTDDVDTSEETESTENDETDVDEEESNEGDASEGDSESDEDTDVNGEGSKEGSEANDEPNEKAEVTGKNEVEENTSTKRMITTLQAKDLGNIFTFESLKIDGTDIHDGDVIVIEEDTLAELGFSWNTEGRNAQAGDTASIRLSDAFEMVTTPEEPILVEGTNVGTYHVENGVLKFEFNEGIGESDVQNGYVNLGLEFNLEKFRENIEQEIPFHDGSDQNITVVAKPNLEHSGIDKEGHPDSEHDAREITWTIDVINTNDEEITEATLVDNIPPGLGEARDFVIHELSVGFDGDIREGADVTTILNPSEFPIDLDTITPFNGYRVQYTTTIENYAAVSFTNEATFEYDEESLEADATVGGLTRSNPIEKNGWQVGNEDVIQWQIDVNKNGSLISEAKVEESLPAGLTVDPGSIEVVRITQVGGNWQEGADHEDSFTAFPINIGALGQNDAYRIKFKANVDWSEVNGSDYQQSNGFQNKATLYDDEDELNDDDATVTIVRDPILRKVGASNVDYDNKTVTWTIHINEAGHPIGNVVLTDLIPEGLTITEGDIDITDEEGNGYTPVSINLDPDADGGTEVVIDLGNVGTRQLEVKYTTEITDFTINNFKNGVGMTGDGIGPDGENSNAEIRPVGNTYGKSFEGIDYNEKTIDWKLNVDPRREAIDSLIIEDTFPNKGLILLPDTVEVRFAGSELTEGTDYTLAPRTEDGETGYHKGFTITILDNALPLDDGQLIVDYQTSYDPQLVVDGKRLDPHEPNVGDDNSNTDRLYVNSAHYTGETVNENEIDEKRNASQRVREDSWNSGKKEGQLVHFVDDQADPVNGWVSGSERKIAWQLYMNYQEQNLGTGVVVTDELAYAGDIDADSIQVSVYGVDSDGKTTITDNVLDPDNYSVNTGEDGKFILTFADGFEVTERYVIEFTTSVPDISVEKYTNNATVTAGGVDYKYSATLNYNEHDDFLAKRAVNAEGNRVFTGDEVDWEVKVNESLSIIKEAVITDTISAGHIYVNDSLKIYKSQDRDNALEEETDYTLEVVPVMDANDEPTDETNLVIDIIEDLQDTLVLEYTTVVTETNGQIGNSISLEGTAIDQQSIKTDRISARQFSNVGGQWASNRGALSVTKVDTDGATIETGTATFELWYDLNGERVQFEFAEPFTTIDGILEIGNLPLRTYYLKETEAPNGYILSDEEIEIVVGKAFGNNENNIFKVSFENVKKVDITVEKFWDDANNQDGIRSNSITVNLLANDDEISSIELNKDNDWSHLFTELPEIGVDGEKLVYTVEEVEVAGYETTISGTSEDGFVITNKHEPELINLEGTKTWDDADNQDGVRPNSITVNLLANGTKVEDVEVTAETDWTFSFTDLPKFENGEEINYTVQEDGVEDYSTEITGMDITNSYTPEQTSINVVKAWDDANNQDGIRPESITVKLLANGEETGKEVQLNEGNNWQADFTELDVYVDGEKIVYTVEEVEVAGYETTISGTSEDGFVITNSHEPELINLDGTKTWDDADNQDGVRPVSITVNLLANGTKVEDVEVTEETDWTFSFTDLPKFENGAEINYTVQEDNVEDYSTEIDGMDITNSYTPEQISINVVKAWDDANNQDGVRSDSITVKLLADGEETGKEVQLNEGNNWQADFTELDVYVDGEEIVYTVEEVEVAGYKTSISGTSEDGFVIRNTHEPELINLEGTKTWDDADNQDGKRPDSITVNLLANGEKIDSVEVTAETDSTFEFTDLPKYENGEEINYTVQEDGVEDYSTEIDGMDITNSYTPSQTSVNVVKNWKDENYKDVRPDSITVKLLADGEEAGQELELNADNNWQVDFMNLDEYVDGEKVVYTIEEVETNGYVTESISGNADNGFVITNRPAKVSVGDYVWFDANKDGLQDETDIPLEGVVLTVEDEDGNPVTDVYGNPVGPTTTDEKGWYTFDNLPIDHTYTVRIDQEASAEVLKEYVPTLHEEGDDHSIDSSTWEATSRHLVEDGERDPTLDFGFIKEEVDVVGIKTWEDADNQDGERPDSITVNLLANGEQVDSIEVTEEDDWKYSFTDLPKHEYLEEIVYTVTENTVEGYTPEIDGYNITNHYTPGETAVTVTKNWQDANNQDGIRPASIEVRLIADGEAYGDPVELSEANNWTHTWTELAEKAAGTTIVYTVEEVTEVPGYEVTVNDADHGNIIITNAYTPEEIEITGTKTWDDADNEAGTRPESITVNLLANGSIVDSIEVTEADDWNYSFTGLAKYESGEEIEYSITEVEVDGYETSINGYDITNTLIPVEEEPEKPVSGGESGDKDPKDPTDLEAAGEEGDNLPKTATNIYNLTLIGFGLMLLGVILFLVRRKRIE